MVFLGINFFFLFSRQNEGEKSFFGFLAFSVFSVFRFFSPKNTCHKVNSLSLSLG